MTVEDEFKYEPFVNSASSSTTIEYDYKGNKTASKMQEYFRGLVRAGIIPQEPNYDAMSMKIYITYLEEENATLKEMLKKLAVPINKIDELLKEYGVEVEE